jgi:hypothetical protein
MSDHISNREVTMREDGEEEKHADSPEHIESVQSLRQILEIIRSVGGVEITAPPAPQYSQESARSRKSKSAKKSKMSEEERKQGAIMKILDIVKEEEEDYDSRLPTELINGDICSLVAENGLKITDLEGLVPNYILNPMRMMAGELRMRDLDTILAATRAEITENPERLFSSMLGYTSFYFEEAFAADDKQFLLDHYIGVFRELEEWIDCTKPQRLLYHTALVQFTTFAMLLTLQLSDLQRESDPAFIDADAVENDQFKTGSTIDTMCRICAKIAQIRIALKTRKEDTVDVQLIIDNPQILSLMRGYNKNIFKSITWNFEEVAMSDIVKLLFNIDQDEKEYLLSMTQNIPAETIVEILNRADVSTIRKFFDVSKKRKSRQTKSHLAILDALWILLRLQPNEHIKIAEIITSEYIRWNDNDECECCDGKVIARLVTPDAFRSLVASETRIDELVALGGKHSARTALDQLTSTIILRRIAQISPPKLLSTISNGGIRSTIALNMASEIESLLGSQELCNEFAMIMLEAGHKEYMFKSRDAFLQQPEARIRKISKYIAGAQYMVTLLFDPEMSIAEWADRSGAIWNWSTYLSILIFHCDATNFEMKTHHIFETQEQYIKAGVRAASIMPQILALLRDRAIPIKSDIITHTGPLITLCHSQGISYGKLPDWLLLHSGLRFQGLKIVYKQNVTMSTQLQLVFNHFGTVVYSCNSSTRGDIKVPEPADVPDLLAWITKNACDVTHIHHKFSLQNYYKGAAGKGPSIEFQAHIGRLVSERLLTPDAKNSEYLVPCSDVDLMMFFHLGALIYRTIIIDQQRLNIRLHPTILLMLSVAMWSLKVDWSIMECVIGDRFFDLLSPRSKYTHSKHHLIEDALAKHSKDVSIRIVEIYRGYSSMASSMDNSAMFHMSPHTLDALIRHAEVSRRDMLRRTLFRCNNKSNLQLYYHAWAMMISALSDSDYDDLCEFWFGVRHTGNFGIEDHVLDAENHQFGLGSQSRSCATESPPCVLFKLKGATEPVSDDDDDEPVADGDNNRSDNSDAESDSDNESAPELESVSGDESEPENNSEDESEAENSSEIERDQSEFELDLSEDEREPEAENGSEIERDQSEFELDLSEDEREPDSESPEQVSESESDGAQDSDADSETRHRMTVEDSEPDVASGSDSDPEPVRDRRPRNAQTRSRAVRSMHRGDNRPSKRVAATTLGRSLQRSQRLQEAARLRKLAEENKRKWRAAYSNTCSKLLRMPDLYGATPEELSADMARVIATTLQSYRNSKAGIATYQNM